MLAVRALAHLRRHFGNRAQNCRALASVLLREYPMHKIDWQSEHFANMFEQYDRADFAQEFLRRNPVYQRQYDAARNLPAARGRVARRWGLVFRLQPRT